MLNLAGCWHDVARARRRVGYPAVALVVMGLVGCSDPAGPPEPGAILVRTETAGFLKASGYDLVVAGNGSRTIGATDEVTIAGIEPGSYVVELANVPANCSAEAVNVAVAAKETTAVTFAVNCTYEAPVSYTVQFTRQRPDLDTNQITVCAFGICPSQEEWDFYVHNNINTQPRSVIRHNTTTGVQIAHVADTNLAALTEAHFAAANFTTTVLDVPFGTDRVILIRTDLGNVFALGNPVENLINGTLTFSAARIARP
jgi:hypothetical protein